MGAAGAHTATVEELALLARLSRSLGSDNIDFRLRYNDPGFSHAVPGVPWLGMSIEEFAELDRVLVVGSFLRKDHPLLAQRLRQAAKHGTQIAFIDSSADDPLFPVAARQLVAPTGIPDAIAQVLVAWAKAHQQSVPQALASVQAGEEAEAIAAALAGGEKVAVMLGNMAVSSPQASLIAANGQALAQALGAKLGFLTPGGDTVGGYLAGAIPQAGGLNAEKMLQGALKGYIVMPAEPALDSDNGAKAIESLKNAQFAVALTSYFSAAADWADVMLPIAPFTETSGTFVNAEGRAQSYKGTAAPYGDSRPAWKVLPVMGNLLELSGFDDETSESVRDTVLVDGIQERLSNHVVAPVGLGAAAQGLQRVADVPIYRSDALVRRAEPLQETRDSRLPTARMNAATLQGLGLSDGDSVRVRSEQGEVTLTAELDPVVANGAVRIS